MPVDVMGQVFALSEEKKREGVVGIKGWQGPRSPFSPYSPFFILHFSHSFDNHPPTFLLLITT